MKDILASEQGLFEHARTQGILARLFASLYVSEGWYDAWLRTGRVHHKARAVVLFDRCMADELKRAEHQGDES